MTPDYIMIDLSVVFIIGSFIFLFKSYVISLIYLSSWIFLFCVLYLANTTMFNIFGDIFSIDKLLLVDEAILVFEWSYLKMDNIITALSLFLGFILLNLFIHYLFRHIKVTFQRVKAFVLFLICFITIYFFRSAISHDHIIINGLEISEKTYISTLKKSALNDYGLVTFYLKEIELITNDYNEENIVIDDKQNYSKYHGLLKDKNVIMIMIESGQEMAINQYLTPNLYRIQNEGLYFSENYSSNKTDVSEFIGISGNYPTTVVNFSKYTYEMPFSVPNVLKEKYVTSYFHDNNGSFYNRGKLMPNLGFEHVYLHDDLFQENLPNWDKEKGWRWCGDYTLDSITIERILPHMIHEDELFYSFWTTLSTHGPYRDNIYSNWNLFKSLGYFLQIERVENNGDWVNPLKNTDNENMFKYYQAAMMDLDKAIGRIFEELEKKELLEDTIIILYGDHNAYYHNLHLLINGLLENENDEINIDDLKKVDLLYDTILYMWNPTLNNKYKEDNGTNIITTFTSPYIIVPTLLDLLGYDYCTDYYTNYSFFDNNYLPVFYSHQLRSYMNNILFTDELDKVNYQAEPVSKEYIDQFLLDCTKFLERQALINNLYILVKKIL